MNTKAVYIFPTLFFFFTIGLFGQTDFYNGSVDELKLKAKNENKGYIIDFYTSWCNPCKKMDVEVFQDVSLGQFINDHFLIKKINAEGYQTEKDLAERYFVNAFPTFIVFDADGNEQGRLVGYYAKQLFLEKIKKYTHHTPNQQFSDFR